MSEKNKENPRASLKKQSNMIWQICVFAMLGALMFLSKLLMELLPNIHLVGMLIIVYTIVYRAKALIPIYLFVLISGVYAGFAAWWLPYLYIWTVLWAVTMLLPKKMARGVSFIVYPVVSAIHGLCFGALYAPVQALVFGLNFEGMIAWIAAGLPFDLLHALGNLLSGFLIVPLSELLVRLSRGHIN